MKNIGPRFFHYIMVEKYEKGAHNCTGSNAKKIGNMPYFLEKKAINFISK